MSPGPSGETPGTDAIAEPELPVQVRQKATASDRARQASLGSGTQVNYFGEDSPGTEAAVSIAAPVGQRDPGLPLRGRGELLTELADASLGAVRVIHGLGGCGKTRLALEAAWRAQQQAAEVWWISAADESRLIAGMHALGRRLDITDTELRHGEAADLIWQRLSGRQQPWLLVIDNADDPQVLAGPAACVGDGTGWLRPVQSAAGMVLVTSRDGRPASWGPWCHRHLAGMLPADQATQVLADYARHQPGLGSDADAAALAERLGRLPLALKLAGSYLAESAGVPVAFAEPGLIRSYQEYKDAVEEGQLDLAFPVPGGAELTPEQARGLIGRTWDLTLDLLETRQVPEARPILRLLASMADAPVPHELLLDPAILADSPFFPDTTGPKLWQALQALAGFGLIDLTRTSDNAVPITRLHPLVRDTSRPRPDTGPDEHMRYLELAARLLQRAAEAQETGLPEDPARWPMWQLLVPHALYTFETLDAGADYPDNSAIKDAAYAAGMAARYQAEQGLHSQAEAMQRAVLAARLRVLGPDHPSTLATRHQVALAMAELGDHDGALAEYRDVLATGLWVQGPDHPSTLTTRHQIAYELAELGDHDGALAEYRDVLATRLRVQGPDHPSTLVTRHAIAGEMAELGDHDGALAEYRDVLTARQRIVGPDHPSTLTTRHQIAYELAELGDHDGALAEYRDVLTARLRVQGPDHPSTLTARNRITVEMAALGDHDGALAEYRDVLTARLRILGPDHPSTLTTRHQIARELAELGDHDGALAEYRDVLTARQRIVGPDHPSTLTTRYAVAYEMAELGDHDGALAEYRDVLTAEQRVQGADHPSTLTTRYAVAYEMAALGDHDGALAEYRDVLTARQRIVGPDHPSTLTTQHQVALAMAELGDHDGALAEYRDVLTARQRVRGPDHPSTLTTRYQIAREMAALGDHHGALAEYRDVLTARQRVQGPDHPSTLTTRYQIAREMAALGDHHGALAEYRDVLTAEQRVQGPDHPSTLTTRYQIAREMAALGDHDSALAEYRDVLTTEQRVQGPDHPSTLTTRHEIAREMAALGDHDGALAEYRDVLTARLRVLGPDHPSTVSAADWVTYLEAQGKR